MTKPTKLIFVVTEDWYFVSHRLGLAVAALEAGYQVSVASRMTSHLKVIEKSGIVGIPLRRMKRSSINFFDEMASFLELVLLFRREKPDLVHLVALKPVIYGSLASLLIGRCRRVNAFGGLGSIFSSKHLLERLFCVPINTVLRLIGNTSNTRLILQNVDDQRHMIQKVGINEAYIHMIRGAGVDLTQFPNTPLPGGEPIVMLAARMLWNKGVGEFVGAAKQLKQRGCKGRFVLVGNPDYENPSSVPDEQLRAWHDSGVVEWWGYREDMSHVLTRASLVCLPTYYGEGLPKVLIEAMACARPIITTNISGCRDLVKDGSNGMIIEPKNVSALADAIATILGDLSLGQKMGGNGRLLAERDYSLDRVVSETLCVYRELIDQ